VVPIVAILAMLFIAVFMFKGYPLAWAAAGGWIILGWFFYAGYSRKRETAFQARTTWMERIDREEYRVLVGISNLKRLPTLMEVALAATHKQKGELVVLHVVEVPEGEALSVERTIPPNAREVLEAAVTYAAERGVEARPVIRIGHRVSHSLVQTARELECNFLILGQARRPSFMERLVSSVVDRVLQVAPCQVGVVLGSVPPTGVTGVVVPVTQSGNAELAIQLAPAFADWFKTAARAVTVVDRSLTETEAEAQADEIRAMVSEQGAEVPHKVLRRRDPARAVARGVKAGELVLIGAPSTGPLMPLIGETVPTLVARYRRNVVVVVRAVAAAESHRFERVFFKRQ
jgi:nucleotide-binding universal stress UspA family protein